MKRKPPQKSQKRAKPPSKIEVLQGELAELRVALGEVVAGFEELHAAFNKNTEAFSKNFCYADTFFWILRKAMNDQLNGKLLVTEPEPGVHQVDLIAYTKLYEASLIDNEAAPEKKDGSNGQPIIFGGA